MGAIPIRTLNQDTASVLARVERGESLEITRRGRVIGRIVPVARGELHDLIEAGKVIPATVTDIWTVPDQIPSEATGAQ